MSVPRAAMILAAGRGERMLPLTRGRAKPTLPVLGVPILGRILRFLSSQGVREAGVNASHAPESIADALDRYAVDGLSTSLYREERLMGSGGALAAPAEQLGAHDTFVVHNGDTVVDAPLERLAHAVQEGGKKRLGALLVRPGLSAPYRPVTINEDVFVDTGAPGADAHEGESPATYLGVAVFKKEILAVVPKDRPSGLFEDVLLPLLSDGAELAVVPYTGRWLEFTSPERYMSVMTRLLQRSRGTGRVALPGGDAALVATDSGATFLAPEASIDPGASVKGALIVERGARVGRGAILDDCVLLENASAGANVRLTRVVVDRCLAVGGPCQHRDGTLSPEDDRASFQAAVSPTGPAEDEALV